MLTKMIKVNWSLDRTKKKTTEEGYKKGVQTAEQYKRHKVGVHETKAKH